MSHVSICFFRCGPAGLEVEIFVAPLVGDVLHTHGQKTAPLTSRRILAERLQIGRMLVPRRSVWLPLKLCKFKIPGRLLRSNPIVIPSLNFSAHSAEVSCLWIFKSSLVSLLHSFATVASAAQLVKRALVSLLLALAQQCAVKTKPKREDDDSLQFTCERWRALRAALPTDRASLSKSLSRLAPNLISLCLHLFC